MIYKFSFSVTGDNFSPKNIIDHIQGDFTVESMWESTDKKFLGFDDEYHFGGIIFWHPNKYCVDKKISSYENDFVEFLEKNYQLFILNSVDNFEFYLEIYYDGIQCNFEIFNKELIKRISIYNISMPISIYSLQETEYNDWVKEISWV